MKWVITSAVPGTNRHVVGSTKVIGESESVVECEKNAVNLAAEIAPFPALDDQMGQEGGYDVLCNRSSNYLPKPGKFSLLTLSVTAVPPATGWRVIRHVVYVIVSPLTLVSNLSISLNLR